MFSLIVKGLSILSHQKHTVFSEAIRKTQTEGQPVTLKLFKECVGLVQKVDLSKTDNREKLVSHPLDEWPG